MEQKAKSLTQVQEQQVVDSVRGKSGLAAKLKQAAMMTKHKQQVDDFRLVHITLQRLQMFSQIYIY